MALVWARCQRGPPGSGSLPAAPRAPGALRRGRVIALDEPMPPWDVTPREMLGHGGVYRYE
ncbi:hypothetical protein PL81_01285 [Streptomyces sp. RSD-27]|nr:hypothetical protein PL81_01285 [Streptomyces sp. RSD-27]